MSRAAKFAVFLVVVLLILGSIYYYDYSQRKKESAAKPSELQVDQFLIKVLLREGSNFTTQLRVMNSGDKGVNVKVGTRNLPFMSVSQQELYLDYGQTSVLDLEFDTGKGSLTQAPG